LKEKLNRTSNSELFSVQHDGLIAIGRVIKAQGLRGEVKVEQLSNVKGRFELLDEVTLELKNGECIHYDVEYTKMRGVFVILKLNGIDTRDDAEILRSAYVNVSLENIAPLEHNSYYAFDLVGAEVFDLTNKKVGFVKRVEYYPANDVIIIEKEDEDIMIPAISEYIVKVNIKAKKLTVNLPEGLPTYPHGV